MNPSERLPIVGVMGSGREPHSHLAEPLGRWIGEHGFHLLMGGGGGAMLAVSRAFASTPNRRGHVIGIIPGDTSGAHYCCRPGFPNAYVEIAIFTHLPLTGADGTQALSRNHINVLSSDVIVALPGGEGTASEVQLALKYRKPTLAFLGEEGQIPGLPECVPTVRDNQLVRVGQFILAATNDWPARRFSSAGG